MNIVRYPFVLLLLCSSLTAQQMIEQLTLQRQWQEGNTITPLQQQQMTLLPTLPLSSFATASILPPLLRKHDALQRQLPYISLASLPTPIMECSILSQRYGCTLTVKCDNYTGAVLSDGTRLFGGNKVRKLEFLLADAVARGYTSVLTFGCAGSNHALATTVYAQQLALASYCMLKPQHASKVVQRNLLLQQQYGAHLFCDSDNASRMQHTIDLCQQLHQQTGQVPYIIPTGGSTPLGVLGFVNAIYELAEQVADRKVRMPDLIYAPLGSSGTAAGLLLGLALLRLPIQLVVAAVEPASWDNEFETRLAYLFTATNQLLHSMDPSIPLLPFPYERITIDHRFAGEDYALFTHEGVAAIREFAQEGIQLDGVYTGKTAAGLLALLQQAEAKGKRILFWNTFCNDAVVTVTGTIAMDALPVEFRQYFTKPMQRLDQ